jgi:hypothetical protein
MSTCVYCGVSENLNTTLQITLDGGEKVTVSICDEHAEEATIKSARIAFTNKQKQIDDFLAQAKALGLNISINSGNNLSVAQAPAQQVPVQQIVQQTPQVQPSALRPILEGDDVVSTDLIDNKMMRSVGGGGVESFSSFQAGSSKDKLDPSLLRGRAKITMMEGREGIPIAIPEQRVDGTGTTRIKISKRENDQNLQNRFKRMAEDSIRDRSPDFKSGYRDSMKSCPLCHESGSIRNMNQDIVCPKCQGSGVISVY